MNDVGLYYWSWMMTLLIVSFTTNYSSTENRSFYVEIQQSALFWISVHIHLMSYHWCLTFVDCSYCARINFIWNFVWLFGITLDIVSAERMMKKWVKLWCFVYNPCFGSCFWFLHRVEWWMLYCAFILLATLENQRMHLFAQFGSMTMHILVILIVRLLWFKFVMFLVLLGYWCYFCKRVFVIWRTANSNIGFCYFLLQIVEKK